VVVVVVVVVEVGIDGGGAIDSASLLV